MSSAGFLLEQTLSHVFACGSLIREVILGSTNWGEWKYEEEREEGNGGFNNEQVTAMSHKNSVLPVTTERLTSLKSYYQKAKEAGIHPIHHWLNYFPWCINSLVYLLRKPLGRMREACK